jgi:Zn-dependent M28 family amino/carboxypeptidase
LLGGELRRQVVSVRNACETYTDFVPTPLQNGLLGSKWYTQHLNATDANNILTYLNFDMVSRGYFGVFDGDGSTHNLTGPPGSAAIEKLFVEHFTKNGVNVTAARFTGGSDYQSFMNIGKPVGGLHTGTGVEQDPCYHQACDTIDNPNQTTLTINAKVSNWARFHRLVKNFAY